MDETEERFHILHMSIIDQQPHRFVLHSNSVALLGWVQVVDLPTGPPMICLLPPGRRRLPLPTWLPPPVPQQHDAITHVPHAVRPRLSCLACHAHTSRRRCGCMVCCRRRCLPSCRPEHCWLPRMQACRECVERLLLEDGCPAFAIPTVVLFLREAR